MSQITAELMPDQDCEAALTFDVSLHFQTFDEEENNIINLLEEEYIYLISLSFNNVILADDSVGDDPEDENNFDAEEDSKDEDDSDRPVTVYGGIYELDPYFKPAPTDLWIRGRFAFKPKTKADMDLIRKRLIETDDFEVLDADLGVRNIAEAEEGDPPILWYFDITFCSGEICDLEEEVID